MLDVPPERQGEQIRTCLEKAAFLTNDEAHRVIHAARKKRGERMKSYRCPFCQCFHLTKQGVE